MTSYNNNYLQTVKFFVVDYLVLMYNFCMIETSMMQNELFSSFSKEACEKHLNQLISERKKSENKTSIKKPFSFLLLDIDNFRYFHETYGELTGRKVLNEIALTIKKLINEKIYLSRISQDEFAIILENTSEYDELWSICHKILIKIHEIELSAIDGQPITLTASASRFPEDGNSAEELFTTAEKAMTVGKSKGRNCFVIYDAERHFDVEIPKTEKSNDLGSINLHASVFRFLTCGNNLKKLISNLVDFLSSYFEIHNLCIQSENQILFQKIHNNSKNTNFSHSPHEYVKMNMNSSTGIFYLNNTKSLINSKMIKFYQILNDQKIISTCY